MLLIVIKVYRFQSHLLEAKYIRVRGVSTQCALPLHAVVNCLKHCKQTSIIMPITLHLPFNLLKFVLHIFEKFGISLYIYTEVWLSEGLNGDTKFFFTLLLWWKCIAFLSSLLVLLNVTLLSINNDSASNSAHSVDWLIGWLVCSLPTHTPPGFENRGVSIN